MVLIAAMTLFAGCGDKNKDADNLGAGTVSQEGNVLGEGKTEFTFTVVDEDYRKLVEHIREDNKKCNIGIVSLDNAEGRAEIKELNQHLRMIAESMRCEFEDISMPHVWNPVETKNAMSFAAAMGLSKKISSNKSLYDLAKLFFCLDPEYAG